MRQIAGIVIGISLGLILILAGTYKWKFILGFNYIANAFTEIVNSKMYRAFYVFLGVLLIAWMFFVLFN